MWRSHLVHPQANRIATGRRPRRPPRRHGQHLQLLHTDLLSRSSSLCAYVQGVGRSGYESQFPISSQEKPLKKQAVAAGVSAPPTTQVKRKRGQGYNLADRAQCSQALVHKKVCDESLIKTGEKERFLIAATESRCFWGQRNRTVKMETAKNLHWNAFRRFVGFANPSAPVSVAEVLVAPNVRNYFKHLQPQSSRKGFPCHQSTVVLIGRNLVTMYEPQFKFDARAFSSSRDPPPPLKAARGNNSSH